MQICVTSFNGFQQNNRKSKINQHHRKSKSAQDYGFTSEEIAVNDNLGYPKPYAKLCRTVATVVSLTIVEYHWLRNENKSSIIVIRT
jgi:hypothetical protein